MDTIQQAWIDAFYLSLNGWPGDEAANDLFFTYLMCDCIRAGEEG